MGKLCSRLQRFQPVRLNQGDYVRYIGADPKIQQDYGNQNLRVLAIDGLSGLAICDNEVGQCLVGVALRELQNI
ncbi:MAG: hypothetical protein Kow00121_06730 [Elainellaceae cyanobacterium]